MALRRNGGETGKIPRPGTTRRRSPRRPLELAIRVFGTDFLGKDFAEDSATLEVNRHGAKIRLKHKLIAEQEIHILILGNNREALFRVVRQAGEPTDEFSFWGVECLEPGENIWEGAPPIPASKTGPRPAPPPGRQLAPKPVPQPDSKLSSKLESPVQAMLSCSKCGMRELVEIDATQIQAIRKLRGLVRGCPACGATSLWKRVAVRGS